MPWPLVEIVLALPMYALVLFRISGLLVSAPVFSSSMIPVRIRVGLAIVVAAMVFPLVSGEAPRGMNLQGVLLNGVREFAVGASIGLTASVLLMGAEVAGLLVGQQAGISLSRVFDPSRGTQTTVVAQIYSIVLVFVFLIAGGLRALLAALIESFHSIPLATYHHDDSIVLLLIETLTAAFVLGIRVAGPAVIALLLAALVMGFLSRTMPQLNILSVGFTLRVLVALAVAAIALDACQDVLVEGVFEMLESVRARLGLDPEPVGFVG